METYQIFLMVIGGIASIWLIVKACKGFLWFLEAMLESGFRNRYPYDFLISLNWVISEMESHGFKQDAEIDPGSETPGVIMKHLETKIDIEVRLRAPLFAKEGYCIVVANHNNNTAIVMPNTNSEENRKLLNMFLEQV